MSAPRLLAPTTISGGVPTAGAGTLNTIALWTPDGNTLGNSLLTQAGNIVTNASGAIRATGTSQTSPAFMRHDATTSGIYFPATNEIGFTISNQHAMFISSGRFVGIGTVNPGTKLDVADTGTPSGTVGIRSLYTGTITANAGGVLALGGYFTGTSPTTFAYIVGGKDNAIAGDFGGHIQFITRPNGGVYTERARIDSAGNVGIGVIPSAWASSVRAEEMRTHARWNYNSGSDSVAYWTVNAFLNSAGNAIYKATAAASQYTQIGGAHVWERAVSGTSGNTVTWLESARIDSSGYLGIGTASPLSRLNVAGTTGLTWGGPGDSSALVTIGTQGTAGGSLFVNTASLNSSFASGLAIDGTYSSFSSVVNIKALGVKSGGGYGSSIAFHTSSNTALNEQMRLDSSGYLGIGTASPGAQLHVERAGGLSNAEYLRLRNTTAGSGSAVSQDYYVHSNIVATGRIQHAWNGTTYDTTLSVWNNSLSSLQEAVRVQGGGNVGIGTASPGAILHTLGTGTTTGIFATSSANAWMELRRSTSTTLGYIGTGSGLVTGGAAADLAFRCESGNLLFSTVAAERARIDSSGRLGIGLSPSAFILETATDASIYGVRVGRGAGAQATNTVVGNAALNANTTGTSNTAVGNFAANAVTTGAGNTSIGFQANALLQGGSRNTAVGESAGYAALSSTDNTAIGRYAAVYNTGSNNVAVGSAALNGVSGSSSGGSNVAIGANALSVLTLGAGNTSLGVSSGSNITTGSNNILLGANAITVTATASNQLVIGSSGNYVATNGGATTWYTTATAQSSGVLPATCGFIRVLLNGTYVKIPVYAD